MCGPLTWGPRLVNLETESRRWGLGLGGGSGLSMGTKSLFGKMKGPGGGGAPGHQAVHLAMVRTVNLTFCIIHHN